MSDYFMKVSGDTKVLAGSSSGFTQENQCSDSNQKFDIDPNGSFGTIKCLNNQFWKYFQSSGEVKLVGMPPAGNVGKFQVKSNGSDYEVFCKAVNNGTTRIAIAGAYEFDLDPVS